MNVIISKARNPMSPLQLSEFDESQIPQIKFSAHHLTPYETAATRRNRAREFKLTPPPIDSFLLNQSLPNVHKDPENGNASFDMGEAHKFSIDKFRGDTLDSISYSPFKASPRQRNEHNNRHLNGNWLQHQNIEANAGNLSLHAQNPNKLIVTIDAETTEILTANRLASEVLNIRHHNGPVKLSDYIVSPEDQYLFSEADLKPNGELVLFSGKVMDLVTCTSQQIVPVSVWARRIASDADYRCLVVMEPVERITGIVKFDCGGKIVGCDDSFVSVFGYSDPEDVARLHIFDLIPNFEFSFENNLKMSHKQCVTGRTRDGFIFPLSIQVTPCSAGKAVGHNLRERIYEGTVWIFSNISGLITLLPDGTVHSCNTNFSLLFFGYSQHELVGKNISIVIPSFYDDYEFLDTDSMALPPFDDDDDSNAKCGTSDGRTTADSIGGDLVRPMNPIAWSPNNKVEFDDFHRMPSYSVIEGDLSASPSQQSFSHPLSVDQCDRHLDTSDLEGFVSSPPLVEKPIDDTNSSKNELSTSSSRRSRHLSYSESQDTLHSGTNSITGSDINANFFAAGDGQVSADALNDSPSEYSYSHSEASYSEDDCESESDENESSGDDKHECSFGGKDGCLGKGEEESIMPPKDFSVSEVNSLSCREHVHSRSISESGLRCASLSTKISTPKESSFKPQSDNSSHSIVEGEFVGLGRHRDGTDIAIEYHIKKVILDDGKCLFCLWVSRDPGEVKESSPLARVHYNNKHTESSETSHSESERSNESASSGSSSNSFLSDSAYTNGNFSEKYGILNHLRKGAFGCIKRAYRKSDGLLVITKFVRKKDIYEESWVNDNKLNKKVPLEISILNTVDHPNIVKMLDVFENEDFFQMVMEKHGNGMDLFEFIERRPNMDEPLGSYLFRQIVSALSYLHGRSILHRDIKDENLIIDERFHVKLIDFGSAAFMQDGLFTTFCGTMEYCSPEVIRGNKYQGPELEMFALGVTLYTMMAGENPFIGGDEILMGVYDIPSRWSDELTAVVNHLLEPDPLRRCTLAELEKDSWVQQPICISDYEFGEVLDCSAKELFPVKYLKGYSESNDATTDSDASNLSSTMSNLKLDDRLRSLTESEVDFCS